MPALFQPWSNTALRLVLLLLLAGAVGLLLGLMYHVRTPWNTLQFYPLDQPVEFDHRHHAADDEIDCLYCHVGAERSAYAGVPPTEVCIGCHAQVWNQSPLLEPVRRSYFSGEPIPWNRVHDLGDFTYLNHAVHVTQGIGCVSCHGRVDRMARVYRVTPLTMGWCLDCHRDPERQLRDRPPRSAPYDSMWGANLALVTPDAPRGRREITALTTCSACHR
jgi:hypothetical protein